MGPFHFLTLYKYYTINFLFFQIIFLIWCAVSENIHRNHTHLFRVAQTILEYLTELPPLYEVSLLSVPKYPALFSCCLLMLGYRLKNQINRRITATLVTIIYQFKGFKAQ